MNRNCAVWVFLVYVIGTAAMLISAKINIQKKKIQETEDSKNRIVKLMNIINSYVVIWNEDASILLINDKFRSVLSEDVLRLERSEILDILFPGGFVSKSKAEMMLSGPKEYSLDSRLGNIYINWTSSLLIGSDGEGGIIVSIGFDVTENKMIRQQLNLTNNLLATSEKHYSLAMNLSEIGIILNEHCAETFHISEELQKMLGIVGDTIRIDDFIGLIHKDERMLFESYLKAARANSIRVDHTNSMDLRIRSYDGRYRWYTFRYKNSQKGQYGMPVIGGAIIDISKDKEKDILIERMAYIDEITGIYNRNKLVISGAEMYECCKILELSYWVIVFDIDNFHIINDTCGYGNGNKMLKEFSDILYKKKGKNGFAARIGGDNFALIVQDYGDSNLPLTITQEIQEEIANIGKNHDFKQNISCSAGYSRMPADGEDFLTVFERAEFALSTGEKKRSLVMFDSRVHDSILTAAALERSLADAIEAGELVLYYQPKISIKTKKIMGVEALIRWIKPDGTVVSPEYFVPVAENSHLITKIGEYVMDEACRQNKLWQNMGLPPIVMSINLTSEDFYQKDVKQFISEKLMETGLSPEWLEIELTESLAMKDIDFAVQQMQELRDIGLKLAMDDFGTGYSSLSYIQKMPITLLKLDKSFITLIEDDNVAREIVSAIIKIAKSKRINTIAEGVETEGQLAILEELGCDFIQGFLFERPMNADALTEYLRRSME
ncbi:MAG: GGDEF and EAL domain-containing protein [Oscillospiraceae bacterium]|nr:GGDEF and EAL domain-containing protein [Oscillospiraceae bacterium]